MSYSLEICLMAKDDSITVRVPAELKAALNEAAKRDGRKLSNLVEIILKDWAAAKPKRRDRT